MARTTVGSQSSRSDRAEQEGKSKVETVIEGLQQEEQDLIAEARKILNESLAKTAAMVLALHERFGKSLYYYAKEVTIDTGVPHRTIEKRASRLQKARSEGVERGTSTPVEVRRAKSDLRKDGVLDAVLDDPEVRDTVERALDRYNPDRITDPILEVQRRMTRAGKELDEARILYELGHVPSNPPAANLAVADLRDKAESLYDLAFGMEEILR